MRFIKSLLAIMKTTATTSTTGNPSQLRLHVYDHCPYCIRVELALGWHKMDYDRVVYGYGDRLGDEGKKASPHVYDGGMVLTGKKELPVLEKVGPDGEREWLKAESLDIIDWIRETQPTKGSFPPKSGREDLKEYFHTNGRFKIVQRILSRPRNLRMTHLKDWEKEQDRAYAKAKYEKGGFDYAAAQASDAEGMQEMKTLLQDLAPKIVGKDDQFSLYPDGVLGFDDLLYLPELRTLSLVQGLEWPDQVKEYVVSAFAKAKVETYFDHQVM